MDSSYGSSSFTIPAYPCVGRPNEGDGLAGEGAETVEPILDSFGGYSTDNLSNFYFPYIIILLMIFREQVGRHVSLILP